MLIGEAIRDRRERCKLSQAELAERAGISRVYVSQLERDMKSPTLAVFCKLCAAIKIAPSKFLAEIEGKK